MADSTTGNVYQSLFRFNGGLTLLRFMTDEIDMNEFKTAMVQSNWMIEDRFDQVLAYKYTYV